MLGGPTICPWAGEGQRASSRDDMCIAFTEEVLTSPKRFEEVESASEWGTGCLLLDACSYSFGYGAAVGIISVAGVSENRSGGVSRFNEGAT
jgi:hypothetical protein